MLKLFKKSALALTLAVTMTSASVADAAQMLYGDANLDNQLTSSDAAYVLSYVLDSSNSIITEDMLFYLDVTGDGAITATDAAAILAKVLDSSYIFECEKDDITSGSGGDITTSGTTVETPETTDSTTDATTQATTQTESTTELTTVLTTEPTTETQTEVQENSIKLGNYIFTLGQSESSLPKAYSVGTTPDGLTCYSYSEDYLHYTRVSVQNGKVVSIVTFDKDAVYDGYSIGTALTDVPTDPYYYTVAYKTTRKVRVEFYYDSLNSNSLYSISLTEPGYLSSSNNYTNATISELQRQILDMTNAYRALNNVDQLSWNTTLAKVAQSHAEDMAGNSYFSHKDLSGNSSAKRIENSGLKYSLCGENIDAGYYDAETALNGWINSEGHRKNLINAGFTHIGIGTAYNANDSMGYCTRYVQDFMRPM